LMPLKQGNSSAGSAFRSAMIQIETLVDMSYPQNALATNPILGNAVRYVGSSLAGKTIDVAIDLEVPGDVSRGRPQRCFGLTPEEPNRCWESFSPRLR